MCFKDTKYKSPEVDGACVFIDMNGKSSYHERCICNSVTLTDCRSFCNEDPLCKGYVKVKRKSKCNVATTSPCQPGCTKANVGTVGDLIIGNDRGDSFYEGCFVKETQKGKLIW